MLDKLISMQGPGVFLHLFSSIGGTALWHLSYERRDKSEELKFTVSASTPDDAIYLGYERLLQISKGIPEVAPKQLTHEPEVVPVPWTRSEAEDDIPF